MEKTKVKKTSPKISDPGVLTQIERIERNLKGIEEDLKLLSMLALWASMISRPPNR